ncbi:alpha/beta fold hydrolase [Mycobacterium tuberculosis]|uniref:alpha/beta fold hydrolase n=2 Tax=Mycobacterium tuberculosis TaxID=1773 RepID=UPI002549D9CD|nr:alpha/beta fold hydrolase [Mycobacterium tuberculosis]
MPQRQAGDIGATYQDAPTKSINVGGTRFVYRRLGADAGVPVIFLHHLGAVLDNWDPRVVDGIAAKHPVVTFDNRGVGASEGQTPDTVTTMADDAIAFVRALGFDQVDLLGFSLGGFVAQVIAQQEPQLVRKIILAGTGPAGGVGIGKVTFGTIRESIKATLTFRDPKELRFFTRTDSGKSAARQFVKRLKERKDNRDKSITVRAFRSQLKAIHAWGTQKPSDLTSIGHPVLIANGDDDTMVPTSNSLDLADRLPDATLRIYPDAGHGGVIVVASALGQAENPQWYRNLPPNPDTHIQIGSDRRPVRAVVASSDERARLWPRPVDAYADFDSCQSWTERGIPVIILRPR